MAYIEPTANSLAHTGTTSSTTTEWKAGNKRKNDNVITGMVNQDTLDVSLQYINGSGWLSVTLSAISGDTTAKNINIKTTNTNTTGSDRVCRVYLKNSKNTTTKYIQVTLKNTSGGGTTEYKVSLNITVTGFPDVSLHPYTSYTDPIIIYVVHTNITDVYFWYCFLYHTSTGKFDLGTMNDKFTTSYYYDDYDQINAQINWIYVPFDGNISNILSNTYIVTDNHIIPTSPSQYITCYAHGGWDTLGPNITSWNYDSDTNTLNVIY